MFVAAKYRLLCCLQRFFFVFPGGAALSGAASADFSVAVAVANMWLNSHRCVCLVLSQPLLRPTKKRGVTNHKKNVHSRQILKPSDFVVPTGNLPSFVFFRVL